MEKSELINVENKLNSKKLFVAFTLVFVAYIIATGTAIGLGFLLFNLVHPLLLIFILDIVATLVIFIFTIIFNNISFYDPYWSVQPIVIAIYWLVCGINNGYDFNRMIRQILILSLVSFWGIRLTTNWIRGWKGLKHEDWRYVKYRQENPRIFWLIAFIGLVMMPTLLVYLGCISMYPALVTSMKEFNYLDIIALIVTISAILIEFIADEQLFVFSKVNNDPSKVMNLGLWGVSRHPNYFGEISFWWGLFFFALAADFNYLWTICGPISMILLFMVISIPLMEKYQTMKRKEYIDYKKKVSMLIPWFPRK